MWAWAPWVRMVTRSAARRAVVLVAVGGRYWWHRETCWDWGGPHAGGLGNREGEQGGAHRWVHGAVPDVIPGGRSLWHPPCSTACGHGDTQEPQAAAWGPAGPLLQPGTEPGSCDPRPQPQMPASPALGVLQNPVFLAPGIVGENQRHPLVQEELNLPVPMAQWDHHGMVPSTEHGGAARSLPGASQRWGRARSWLMVGLCPASPQGCLARGPTTTPWGLSPAGTWLLTLAKGTRLGSMGQCRMGSSSA